MSIPFSQYSYAETVEVEIKREPSTGNVFHPKEITINVGTTVVWTNTDTIEHAVFSGKHDKLWAGKFFNSGSRLMQLGDKFEHTFDIPGVFPYFDPGYSGPTGKIIVEGEIRSNIALLSMSGDVITSPLPGQRIIIQPLTPYFTPDSTLTVSLDDRTIETAPPEVIVDEDSFFSMSIILPLDITVGQHTLIVKDSAGNIASETFTVGCAGLEAISSSSGVFPVEYQGKKFYVEYSVKNAKITDIERHEKYKSLLLSIKTGSADNATLEIAIPRALLDATIDGMDDVFIVLVDGNDVMYQETHSTETRRTLKITVPRCAEQVEIIATELLSGLSDVEKLEKALEIVTKKMEGKDPDLPIFFAGIDPTVPELVIGIDEKAPLPLNVYKEMLKQLLGDIPMRVGKGHFEFDSTMKKEGVIAAELCFTPDECIKQPVHAKMSNLKIATIEIDQEMQSIFGIVKDVGEDASVTLTIDRRIIDAKKNNEDINFVVLLDKKTNATFVELNKTDTHRTLAIEIPIGTERFDIVGTYVIPEFPIALVILTASLVSFIIMTRTFVKVKEN
jgi:plastocyanin